MNDGLWRLLNEDNVELKLGLKNGIDDKRVLSNVLGKNL